jgi:hypothetical protein
VVGTVPTEAQIPESQLRLRVQRHLDDSLPVALVSQVSASYGRGDPCCACDQAITRNKVQYVVDPRDTNGLSFHLTCHVIWQRECARRLMEREKAYRPLSRESSKPSTPKPARLTRNGVTCVLAPN